MSPANAMQYAVIRSDEFNSMFLFNTAKAARRGLEGEHAHCRLEAGIQGEGPNVGAYIPENGVVGECVNPFHRVGFPGLKPGCLSMAQSQIRRKKQAALLWCSLPLQVPSSSRVPALCNASALRVGPKNGNVARRANKTIILANSVLMAFWAADDWSGWNASAWTVFQPSQVAVFELGRVLPARWHAPNRWN